MKLISQLNKDNCQSSSSTDNYLTDKGKGKKLPSKQFELQHNCNRAEDLQNQHLGVGLQMKH